MTFSYHSPLSEAVGLVHHVTGDGVSIWGYQGITCAMERFDPTWPEEVTDWYLARRDANLMGFCPICGARWPLVRALSGIQFGDMVHEDDCIIINRTWVQAQGRKLMS